MLVAGPALDALERITGISHLRPTARPDPFSLIIVDCKFAADKDLAKEGRRAGSLRHDLVKQGFSGESLEQEFLKQLKQELLRRTK